MSDEGRKLSRLEWMQARAGFLDLLFAAKQANLYLNIEQQKRVAAAWDLLRDPKEGPLKFFASKPSQILMPDGAGHIPKVKIPGKAGYSGH